ncbi:MAG TPA: sialidase family protein [Sphingobacteriaceae bacterium]
MKILKQILFVLFTGIFLFSCGKTEQGPSLVSTAGADAVDPYLTKDHHGNPVISWTEKDPSDSLYRLKYAVYDSVSAKFGKPVTVSTSIGAKASAESMNKVGFKKDGTVIAVFAKRFENEKNPYAGAIYYSMSADDGQNWSTPKFLHSDTSRAYGRGFFDITNLKNGELAAVWLDGRFGRTIKGSSLFFASTEKGSGFDNEQCLTQGTCECCRTDILTDTHGNIHIAFRNIMFPSSLLGKQARDMAYVSSSDNGKTFASVKTISNDHWAIEGCPHTGPSLASTDQAVFATWFTAGGSSGVYYTGLPGSQDKFSPRKPLSTEGRHPQMISITNNSLAFVWEEASSNHPAKGSNSHSHVHMAKNEASAASSTIVLKILNGSNEAKNIALTDGELPEHHPVLISVDDQLLIAWVREENGRAGIYFTTVDPKK